uniref:Uncharacterized protein n=1 Tax=Nelumbo nucifera TaxID=4432 RepID=A0A822ZS39_NELNU|nr:TPA_asm: hypothetical protein HUJ06_017999 [Nelumbo nucifera]
MPYGRKEIRDFQNCSKEANSLISISYGGLVSWTAAVKGLQSRVLGLQLGSCSLFEL